MDGALSGPINRPHLEPARVVYGGEVTFDADQADGDLKAERYTLLGHVRLHETDTTLRAGEVTFDGVGKSASASDALLTRSVFSIRAPEINGTPELIIAHDADITTVSNGGPADYHIRAQTVTLDQKTHEGFLRNATLYLFGARLLTVPRVKFHSGSGGSAAHRQVTIPVFGASMRYGTYVSFGSSLRLDSLPLQYHLLLPTRQSVEATLSSRQTLFALRPPALPPPPPPEDRSRFWNAFEASQQFPLAPCRRGIRSYSMISCRSRTQFVWGPRLRAAGLIWRKTCPSTLLPVAAVVTISMSPACRR